MSNKKGQIKKTKTNSKPSFIDLIKSGDSRSVLVVAIAILIVTYIAYIPSLKNGFTNWDDNVYVPENTLIKSLKPDNIKKIVDPEHHVSLNYHPITILSLAIDYKLSKYNAKTYHTTNLIFHLLNTLLVFYFIFLLSGNNVLIASITSLLFGIHPMHVESVAWISERKDVLYVFFFMLALITYLFYIKPDAKNKPLLFALIIVLYVLSVLSKAMAIVLPLVLLLIDYYKERKFDKIVLLEKVPLLALSVYFGLMAVNIQSNGAIAGFAVFTIGQRICFASYGILAYMLKLFMPIKLTCFYAYPSLVNDHMPIEFYIAPVVVLLLFALCVYLLNKNKHFVFGFLFFVVAVAMVLQFISVGKAIMAERYTYLSYIGLFYIIGVGVNDVFQSQHAKLNMVKPFILPFVAVYMLVFIYLTYNRNKVWIDSDTLWSNAIENNPYNETAYTNRGSYLINKKAFDVDKAVPEEIETERALQDFNISINMNPTSAKVFTNRANIYGLKAQFDLSLKDYTMAIQLDSTDPEVFANRGVTYSIMQQYDNAIADYTKAISMRKNFTVAKQNRAYAYVSSGKHKLGVDELNSLIEEDPTKLDYYIYRGVALFNLGNMQMALSDNSKAIEIDPTNSRAYYNRSATYKAMGKFKEALNDVLKAKSLGYPVEEPYLKELMGKAKN